MAALQKQVTPLHTPLGYAAAAAAILRLAVRLFAHGLTNTVALVLR